MTSEANQIVRQHGLPYRALRPTGGEGNCFFLAIADQLTDEQIRGSISQAGKNITPNHMDIRTALASYMWTNEEFYNNDIVGVWLDIEEVNEHKKVGPKRSRDEIWSQYLLAMFKEGE